ncbi:MAG: NUDIX domain-containing protein [Alphaproteobacteria bacterium]|nr:NUDIX domain-containing protein [Alphaproteobacteria bacterium]
MVRRSAGMAFGASAWVFPGGKVAATDADPAWDGLSSGEYSHDERALRIAAAREVFEESGLLLAVHESGEPVNVEDVERYGPLRAEVEAEPARFMELIRDAGLMLILDRLVPFAHWITPEFEPRRYDTYFFLVAAPTGQQARHDGREAVDHEWVQPEALLAKRLRGEAKLMFPTRLNLEKLAKSATAAQAADAAAAARVVTVSPVVAERDGVRVLRIPAEAGYSVVEETMDRVMR